MKHLVAFSIPASILTIALGIWWFSQTPNQPIHSLPLSAPCELNQASCTISQADVSIRLDVTPKPVPIAKALNITAHIQGIQPTKVQLDINGSNMYMGYNRIALAPQGNGDWIGKSLLAFCTTDAMQWQLTLLIDLPDGSQLQAPFPLTTPYHP